MLKPYSDDGKELDAHFSIESLPEGFDLIVESRGGSDRGPNPARNSAYGPALVQHLVRMQACGMVLQDLQVASAVAMQMEEAARRVSLDGFPLPLPLSTVTDPEALRLAIGRASAAFGRSDSGGGNYTKRMRLRMRWPGAEEITADAISALLARPVLQEQPTADPVRLAERVDRSLQRIRTMARRGSVPPPPGQMEVTRATGTSSRFVRDPEVIAWVLHAADGHCESCTAPAPFMRDDGMPYLEVHHVRPLGEGGPDTIDNAVACCPNCHRRFHHDPERDRLRLDLIGGCLRLNDYQLST